MQIIPGGFCVSSYEPQQFPLNYFGAACFRPFLNIRFTLAWYNVPA